MLVDEEDAREDRDRRMRDIATGGAVVTVQCRLYFKCR